MNHIVALSGGKDSVCTAVRLAEVEPRDYLYLCTPTANEPPAMAEHWNRLEKLLGKSIVRLANGSLESWMEHWNALPSARMRWCTRELKIEPCIAFLKAHQPATLYVGLRADEPEDVRGGIYGPYATYRYPLREWGWELRDVLGYLRGRGIAIPERTDCEWCFDQRIWQWYRLWRDRPESYARAEAWEARTGHTFRSPSRDTWPAPLAEMRAEFARGRKIRGADFQLKLALDDDDGRDRKCRVCSL